MNNSSGPGIQFLIFLLQGLPEVLKKYTDGQIVLLNKAKLNNDCRQKLCKIVVGELMAKQGSAE